jgi:hypothetical protein
MVVFRPSKSSQNRLLTVATSGDKGKVEARIALGIEHKRCNWKAAISAPGIWDDRRIRLNREEGVGAPELWWNVHIPRLNFQ